MDTTYTIRQLAALAGVNHRTLIHYHHIGLLSPSDRTGSQYRLYGEKELLRLQQIILYKEFDFSLKEIGKMLDEPGFNVINMLKRHKKALHLKKERIDTLLENIDKTVTALNGKTMLLPAIFSDMSYKNAFYYRGGIVNILTEDE